MVTGSGWGGIRGGSESDWFPDPSFSSDPCGVVWAESSSESSSSMGAAVGFSFRFADGSAMTNRGSLEAGGAFLGAGSVGSEGGPCGGGRALKAEVGCQNRLRWGEA